MPEEKIVVKEEGNVRCLIVEGCEPLSADSFKKAAGELSDYPYVYIHAWCEGQLGYHFYVGVSNDPIRRSSEHYNTGNSVYPSWQWARNQAQDPFSYYFSSKEMNMSLALDIENWLIESMKKSEGFKNVVLNGNNNPQKNYSNKEQFKVVLNNILKIFNAFFADNLKLQMD